MAFLSALGLVALAAVLTGLLLFTSARRLTERRRAAVAAAKRAREAALVAEAVAYLREGKLTARWVPVNLLRGEECYHATPCSFETVARSGWYEGGGALPVDPTDVASYQPLPPRSMLPVFEASHGSVYVTNQRLVFVGDANSVSIVWAGVRDVTPYCDGCRLDLANERYAVLRTGDARAGALSCALFMRTSLRRGVRTA